MNTLVERAQELRNKLHAEQPRTAIVKYYSFVQSSANQYQQIIEADCKNKRILEFGCGEGNSAIALARKGAVISAIDVSYAHIQVAQASAAAQQVQVDFQMMSAEKLEFADTSFDLACGKGILHHLQLDRAFSGIARTLKPDGKAVFLEPMGHNPMINLYRRLTPSLRCKDEHPLKMWDLQCARDYFGTVETRFYHLSSLLAVPFRRVPGSHALFAFLEATDRLLFASLPWLQRHAWIVILILEDPR
jgi:SAM-dependent methyltransferase